MTTVDWTTPPILRGRHVSLEPLAPSHADGLREAVEDGRLYDIWYTNVPAPADVANYIDGALSKQAKGEQLAFAVRDANGRVVGTTRYYELTPDVPRLQIGYTWYAASVQRTGLNTEAKLLLLGHAFDVLRCAAVGLQTSWFNHASRTAIARLGAKEEGITRNHVRHRDGTLRDTVNFSIIDAEWPGVKANLIGHLGRHA
ncbi:MAG: GNAT family N-acetyltransferase [Lysobacter sp.]|nr:GNAT family N-acetyltransferase [Lysobacter sp.]